VKFLIDAQLPARLADYLKGAGHEAVHTTELPDGNRATDNQLVQRADAEGRVVVTKDQDFRRSPAGGVAASAALVATGNITNNALLSLFELHLGAIVSSFEEADFVELSHNALALGGRAARDDS
jgi:predicted nuclease of predicted toxin-antitoxin system